ncbi:hypothetical protein CVA01_22010 [Corynebacterium variabile]|uniref:Uncharacterized protein n=1 Tax=Corynebacterium variabile TaxID=1727 RepID=A0A4Y4C792_9CORY|nr:hypothetical protein CVA01_22010 [Corynebacterium variabile]
MARMWKDPSVGDPVSGAAIPRMIPMTAVVRARFTYTQGPLTGEDMGASAVSPCSGAAMFDGAGPPVPNGELPGKGPSNGDLPESALLLLNGLVTGTSLTGRQRLRRPRPSDPYVSTCSDSLRRK